MDRDSSRAGLVRGSERVALRSLYRHGLLLHGLRKGSRQYAKSAGLFLHGSRKGSRQYAVHARAFRIWTAHTRDENGLVEGRGGSTCSVKRHLLLTWAELIIDNSQI